MVDDSPMYLSAILVPTISLQNFGGKTLLDYHQCINRVRKINIVTKGAATLGHLNILIIFHKTNMKKAMPQTSLFTIYYYYYSILHILLYQAMSQNSLFFQFTIHVKGDTFVSVFNLLYLKERGRGLSVQPIKRLFFIICFEILK